MLLARVIDITISSCTGTEPPTSPTHGKIVLSLQNVTCLAWDFLTWNFFTCNFKTLNSSRMQEVPKNRAVVALYSLQVKTAAYWAYLPVFPPCDMVIKVIEVIKRS